ncbi:MAG: IPT/TIG domain-containing protein, partial [bacterium]|nr:IPT/TIG domain-containing protein [bacterium]
MNHTHISIRIFVKILLTVAVLIASASGVPALAADSATMRVKNITHPAYSLAETYNEAAGSEPGDIMNFRMIYSSATPATSMEVVLPDNLSFADAVSVVAGTAAAAQVSGQTIVFSFTASTFQIITFNATVASGSNFTGTDHSIEMSFSTNGTPTASDTATITVGPIVTGITPSTGNNSGGIVITEIMGHGLAGATSAVLSLDGTTAIHTFDISGATITDTSITDAGSAIRVPASFTPGEYWVMVTITSSGNELVTNADTTETVKYTATDGIAPVMQTGSNSYIHSSGILALSFNETIDVSA